MAQTDAEPPTSGMGKPAIRTPGTSSGGPDRPILSPTVALVAILLVVLVLLVGGGLFLRQFNAPVTPVAAAPTTVAVSAPTLPAAPTAPPRTLAAATLPPSTSTAATPLPTSRPTAVPTAVATAQPTTDQHSSAAPAGQTAEPSPFPTVAPELRREVETAYTQYWDARAQAVWTLDAAPLDNVSTGDELLALRHDVQQLRTDDRAIKVEVEHQFTVIRVDGDQAQVLDRLRDYSIYVDPTSKQPLPGEVRPDDASAPLLTSLYFLRNADGTWKVERGEAHANN